jgi:hypothetical protein
LFPKCQDKVDKWGMPNKVFMDKYSFEKIGSFFPVFYIEAVESAWMSPNTIVFTWEEPTVISFYDKNSDTVNISMDFINPNNF